MLWWDPQSHQFSPRQQEPPAHLLSNSALNPSPFLSTPPTHLHMVISAWCTSAPIPVQLRCAISFSFLVQWRQNTPPDVPDPTLSSLYPPHPKPQPLILIVQAMHPSATGPLLTLLFLPGTLSPARGTISSSLCHVPSENFSFTCLTVSASPGWKLLGVRGRVFCIHLQSYL